MNRWVMTLAAAVLVSGFAVGQAQTQAPGDATPPAATPPVTSTPPVTTRGTEPPVKHRMHHGKGHHHTKHHKKRNHA